MCLPSALENFKILIHTIFHKNIHYFLVGLHKKEHESVFEENHPKKCEEVSSNATINFSKVIINIIGLYSISNIAL